MIKQAIAIALLAAALSASASSAAVSLSCPEYIETRQELVTPVKDWHVSQDRTLSVGGKLHGKAIGFSAGPPEQMAILAPDSSTSRKGKSTFFNTWRLQHSEQVWFICGYAQTTIQLSKQLPAGLKKCSIQYNRSNSPTRAWCE